jgi:hypothetical protein
MAEGVIGKVGRSAGLERGVVCVHNWQVARAAWLAVADGPSRLDHPVRYCESCGQLEAKLIEDED